MRAGPATSEATAPTTAPPGSDVPFVRFAGVQKTYDGETLVVRDLDLDIAKGEFLTLLGPSGSGKTTCLMMLAGFETVTAGRITLDGRPIDNVPPHKRGIGMVFQNYALFPHMSVAENLAFPLEVRGVRRAEIRERVVRALGMVELSGYERRKPAQLSGGQQQRVALARALVFEPLLVLMDEPLGALDKQLREQMQLEIKHLHERLGVTVVYVTHDQAEALTMSDRIAVFNAGRVQQLSTPSDLYERPMTSFVAGFVGENNRLDGEILTIGPTQARVRLRSGAEISASPVAVGSAGEATSISIRPECIELGEGRAGANLLQGTIAETIYLGDHLRVRVALDGAGEMTARISGAAARTGFAPGSRTGVSFSPEDARALDPAPAQDAAQ